MQKAKEKELDVIREWNAFVRNLALSRRNWTKLNEHFSSGCNLDDMSEEFGGKTVRICRTNQFRYAIEDFLRLCGLRGDMTDFIIDTKKIGD